MSAQFVLKYEVAEDELDGIADAVSAVRGLNLKRSELLKSTILLGVLVLITGYFIVWMLINPSGAWWCLAISIVGVLVSVLALAILWLAHLLQPRTKKRMREEMRDGFSKLKSPIITWSFGDDGFTNQSGDEEAPHQMQWEEVSRVDVTSTVWIIDLRDRRTLLIPAKHVPDLTAGFIVFRAREAGAKVEIPNELQSRMQLPIEGDYKEMDGRSL